jgi:hypothetical protein
MNKWLALALVVTTSGCPDITVDKDETSADPIVEFDPSNSIVPFPNNLLISQETGKVNVPPGCNESAATKATREGVLNKLDGFGTFETAMSVTLTKPIDMASVTADNIVLYKATMDPSTSTAIPILVLPGSSIRYKNQTKNDDGTLTCDTPNPIDSITVIPKIPLDQKSTYIVALKSGLKSMDGEDYVASFTWSLVRQKENPVTVENGVVIADRTPLDPTTESGLAQLLGINLLWNAHATVMQFLEAKGHARGDVLLAWSFKTQTTTDALDSAVAGTPLTQLNDVPLTGPSDADPAPVSIRSTVQALRGVPTPFEICNTGSGAAPAEADDLQCFLKVSLGIAATTPMPCTNATNCGPAFQAGTAVCGSIYSCTTIADIRKGRLKSPQFQADRPNALDPAKPIPGPWTDPVKPTKVKDEQIDVLIAIPTGTPPANGWPTALFQHGLGQSNLNIIAIAGNLAKDPDGVGTNASGIATVAINAVAHGAANNPFSKDRRVQINNQGACATNPGAQCFAGFLSPDLGATRDNIRQTAVDHMQLVSALKKCTGTGNNTCGTFAVDPAHIVYIGQSLGGIIGGISTGIGADFKASVLNVPGVGWADIFENTQTLAIRCTLVDGLIDAGTLVGEKSNLGVNPPTGLCTTDAWKQQPGYKQFAAIGRWILDPADPANFIAKLAPKKTLIQQVVGDQVVPNVATMNQGALLMRASSAAKVFTGAGTPTSSVCDPCTAPTTSMYLLYTNVPGNMGAGFSGNTYGHGSLLSPAPSANGGDCSPAMPFFCDGVFGTAQMDVDAISFLQVNK